MRKNMSKEVTKTTVQIARMVTDENGMPKAERLEDEILLGNVSQEKAQKLIQKDKDFPVTVFGVQADTVTYEMPVEEFIKLAKVKEDVESEEQTVTAE
jgi:hypothetical protein